MNIESPSDSGLSPPILRWPRYPYPGLRPFRLTGDSDESLIFYGRDAQKDEIIARLGRSHLVMVIGPSGCGKSSLIKAGVIPALEAGFLVRAGERWRTLQMRPGRQPVGELARALSSLPPPVAGLGRDRLAADLETLIRSGPSGLWLAMDQVQALGCVQEASGAPERLLLLIDQFEEVFGPQIEVRTDVDWFVRLLVRFFEKPHPNLYVVLTMRTGYIGQCANFVGLAELLNATQYLTPVLRESGLREAITAPAADYQGEVEPALVDALVADMGTGTDYDADNLPLLQHALLWLWLRAWARTGAAELPVYGAALLPQPLRLLLADYEQNGRLKGILERHADDVLAQVASGGRMAAPLAEIMFRRLTEHDPGGRFRRTPATMGELQRLAGCELEQVAEVAAPFADETASLLELRPPEIAAETLVDISHESLIRQWPQLRSWVDAETATRRTFEDLLERARRWVQAGSGWRNTLRDDDLTSARAWRDATAPYRRTADSLRAWAARYATSDDTGWAARLGGPVAAVDALYRGSVAVQRMRRWSILGAAACILGAIAWVGLSELKVYQQRQLTQLADLYANALANRDVPIGGLPPPRSAAVYQELAVLLAEVDRVANGVSTYEHQQRLRLLERAIDTSVRQVLDETIEAAPAQTQGSQQAWQNVIRDCVRTIEPGGRRRVIQVSAFPLGLQGQAAAPSERGAFALLTQTDNVASLEAVRYEGPYSWRPCRISAYRARLDVASVDSVTMDPSARWLIEGAASLGADRGVGPRVRKLDWFEICDLPDATGSCRPENRHWHLESRTLGEYTLLQAPSTGASLLPSAPAGLPAVMPRFLSEAEVVAGLPELDQPASGAERLTATSPTRFRLGDGELVGDALLWDGKVRLSSEAQPGFMISAWARYGDLVAFVVSGRAPGAERRQAAGTDRPCDGRELCTHFVRLVRLNDLNAPDETLSSTPITEVRFVGPPIERIAFGSGQRQGELLFRFAEVGSVATLTWGKGEIKRWICEHKVRDVPAPEPKYFSQSFRAYVATISGKDGSIGAVVARACQ